MKTLKVLTLTALLFIPATAKADTCFADAYGVRKHSPDAWPSWTYQMPGHKGQRCYYASTKEMNRHRHGRVAQLEARRILISEAEGSNPSATAIPIPKARRESLATPHPPYDTAVSNLNELMFNTAPKQRIDDTFNSLWGKQ